MAPQMLDPHCHTVGIHRFSWAWPSSRHPWGLWGLLGVRRGRATGSGDKRHIPALGKGRGNRDAQIQASVISASITGDERVKAEAWKSGWEARGGTEAG